MIKESINKAKANLKLQLMAGFNGFTTLEIPEIPKEWEAFPNSEDQWCGFDLPLSENSSGCLYKANAGSLFNPHKHDKIKEHMTVMNEGGSMKVIVENKGSYIIDYPNSIMIPEGVNHAVEFLTDTVLIIVWHPKFKKGWEAVFKKETR